MRKALEEVCSDCLFLSFSVVVVVVVVLCLLCFCFCFVIRPYFMAGGMGGWRNLKFKIKEIH